MQTKRPSHISRLLLGALSGAFLMGLSQTATGQTLNNNPWSSSTFGSRVWIRSIQFQRINSGTPTTTTRGDSDGGGGAIDASKIFRMLNTNGVAVAQGGGRVNNSDFSLHAWSDSAGEFSQTYGSTGRLWTSFRNDVIVETWDYLTFFASNNIYNWIPVQIELEGTSSPGAYHWVRYVVSNYQPSDNGSWESHSGTGFNGKIILEGGLLIPPLANGRYDCYVGLQMLLRTSSEGPADSWADFGNSAHFRMSLPPGVTVSSASGRFSAPPTLSKITGTIQLLNTARSRAGQRIAFDLVQNGQVVESVEAPLDAQGRYTLFVDRVGSFRLRAKGATWLRGESGNLNLSRTQSVSANFSLRNGDTNGDNIVDGNDVNAVLASFGQEGPAIVEDLNGDQIVDGNDINLVLTNFGQEGA